MELIVEVLGMVDGAMEKAGRERHYFQASQLQADAKRLRHILRTSENVCKDFKCSIYQGLVYVKSVAKNRMTFVTATDPHTTVQADCSLFPELRVGFANNPVFEVRGKVAIYAFTRRDIDAQTAASGAFCGTLLPVTKPETVTGFVQLLTSKWRARDLSQVVNQHAKQDSSPSDVHSSTAPNEFDQAVVRILYAEKYYQCLLKGKWEQARMLDLGKNRISEGNQNQSTCNSPLSQLRAADDAVVDNGSDTRSVDSDSDDSDSGDDNACASADEGDKDAPCDSWSNGLFMPVSRKIPAACAVDAQDEDGCLMS